MRFEKSLWSSGPEGEKIKVYQAQHERQEGEFVTATIEHLHASEQIPLSQMVIFYRTNFQSRVFEDQLILKRIPYKIIGGISFYLRKEIKDILSFLRLLEYPNDLVAFLRVVNLPKRGFGEQFLAKIVASAQNQQIALMDLFFKTTDFSTLGFSVSAKQKEGWLDFSRIMCALKEVKSTQSLSELVRAAIMQTRYLEVIDADSETKQEKRENLAELIVKAEEWERGRLDVAQENEDEEIDGYDEHIQLSKPNSENNLSRFLEEISLASSTDQMDAELERVNLMTVHNGKGLEFDTVFLAGLEEELFPHINSKKTEEQIEEERRLFYVGVTRAKKQLFLSHASFRHIYGSLRQMRASRFLHEVPSELREKVSFSTRMNSSSFSFRERAPQASSPAPSLRIKEFATGELVFHPEFGIGRIETVGESSLGLTYDVLFSKDNSSRKLVAQYAPLSRLDK